ncbi:MAG: TonB family protein [Balneolales bacterium]|nr:TonB family protein [Balneolales bacterium]
MKFFEKIKNRKLTREERFGLTVSVTTHLVLLLIALLIIGSPDEQDRVAFMEVTLGEFREGAPARQAPEPQPEQQPDPVTQPVDDTPEPTPPQTQPAEDASQSVELPEQTEPVISDDVVVTPPSEVIDPEIVQPDPEPEVQPEPVPEPEPVPVPVTPRPRPGSLLDGDPDSNTNQNPVTEGTGRDDDRSAPYILEWEGNITRQAQANPLPNYTVDVEAIISVRFTVRPDGSVGSVTPVRRSDPDLENEVIRTVRSWRFNRLPSGAPQEDQRGLVTFRFVLE